MGRASLARGFQGLRFLDPPLCPHSMSADQLSLWLQRPSPSSGQKNPEASPLATSSAPPKEMASSLVEQTHGSLILTLGIMWP